MTQQQQQPEKFFDPERWAIVPASDYALGPSNGHACHTLKEAMQIFSTELPARLSNTMRRQKELEDLKLFISGTKSAAVLKQTTAVATVQNEVSTLVGLLREYEQIMLNRIKGQSAEFQTALNERALLVEDTSRKLNQCVSKMSAEDAAGNEAVTKSLNEDTIETILSGMISSDHLLQESATLFGNFPQDIQFNIDRAKDSTLVCPKLVTLDVKRSELKGVPPLIITRDVVAAGDRDSNNETGDQGSSNSSRSPRGAGDSGIRRLLQLPGSEHVQGIFPRTAFGQQLTKRAMNLEEYHRLLHAGCLRTLGSQCGNLGVTKVEYVNPISDLPLRPGRDAFRVFSVCTATVASGDVKILGQLPLHSIKDSRGVTKLESFRTVGSQNYPILWFDFGSSTCVRVDRYMLFHGHETMHCAMRSWRVIGTNDQPFPSGLVAASSSDETLQKMARESRQAVQQRHVKASSSSSPDVVLPDNVVPTVLDVRSREAALGTHSFGGALFECCGSSPVDPLSSSMNNGADQSSSTSPSKNSSNNNSNFANSSPSARHQKDFFRFIGIQLTAPGAGGGYHFELSGVEFFGTMMTMSGQ